MVEQADVGERRAARPDVAQDLRPGAREVARAERRHRACAPLRDRRGVDDGPRRARARVEEGEQRELRGQAEAPVVHVVADDLDSRDAERRDVGAQEVEVAAEGGVRDEVLARLEHHLAGALGGQRRLHRAEDHGGVEPEQVDVGPGEVADLDH